MTVRPSIKVQREFLTNYERATAAGVEYQTGEAVYYGILRGTTYLAFDNISTPLDDEYITAADDELFNRAARMGVQDQIKWVGQG